MAIKLTFTEEEMMIDECLGYPKAYPKLCQNPHLNPYKNGPPFSFTPYVLQPQEASRAEELDQIFPINDVEAKPTTKPKIYANLLWKQLNHLGNAGFDPAKFRVDPYGNVLYYHADSGSPLAWEIDHWFPCSRGGRTVPSNLRLLQWQVCKKKQNKLEFLVPWWDCQLGISVNQFLSIFASSNSDFRSRAFSLLFSDGENEELSSSQTVESHIFPQHFFEKREKVGLAPAAIVSLRKESSDSLSVLRNVDLNRSLRPNSPANASRKFLGDENESYGKAIQISRPSLLKENENPYLTIAMARDSLRRKDEIQTEIRKLDDELDELKQKNEVERFALQDLESVLIKRRRRTEKCRRLAEAQSSYKSLLEKMIRDSMHQTVIYKEQARLNQAATSALMARLEAQKAICDTSEKDLHKKFKQRDEIETQIRPHNEQARKRSRIDDFLSEDMNNNNNVLYLPEIKTRGLQKELRVFLEEEQKASEASLALIEERERDENKELENVIASKYLVENNKALVCVDDYTPIEDKLQELEIKEERKMKGIARAVIPRLDREEDEECRRQRGKGNVEKWLQMLLNNTNEEYSMDSPRENADEDYRTNEVIEKLNHKNPQEDIQVLKFPATKEKIISNKRVGEKIEPEIEEEEEEEASDVYRFGTGIGRRKSFDGKERRERNEKERKEVARCESARAFRPAPYSPSAILNMKKRVDCMGKKPVVIGSDEDLADDRSSGNNFIKSSVKSIKKAVKK